MAQPLAMSPARHMSPVDWAILGLLSIVWGGSFFFIELGVRELPPFTLVLLRVGIGGAALYAWMRLRGQRLPGGGAIWRAFLLLALLNNALPFVLFAWSQQRIDSGLASILNATTPLWGVIVAHLALADERATPGKAAGVVIGIAGVAVMIGGDALGGLGGDALAQLACLGATLCYALAGVYARRFRAQGIGPMAVSTGQLLAAAAMLLPLSLILDAPWSLPAPSRTTILAILGLALLSTSFAYYLYFRLIDRAGATNALTVTFVIPVTAILLGVLVLGERLQPRHFAGMALIGIGLAAIDGRALALLSRKPASV